MRPPSPVYDTVAEIEGMPRCRARVVRKGPCFVCLEKADGTTIFVGSPSSSTEVVNFVSSLEEGQSCLLPAAFMRYREPMGRVQPR